MKGDLAETENSLADDEASSQSTPAKHPRKLATRKFVTLVPDPIVFAPWSVLLGRTASFASLVSTHLTTLSSQGGQLRTGKSDVYQQPPLDVVSCFLLSHAPITSPPAGEQEGRLRRRRRGTGRSPRVAGGSLSVEWEERKKSVANKPRKTVAQGRLSNPMNAAGCLHPRRLRRTGCFFVAFAFLCSLVSWGMFCWFFRCKQLIKFRLLCGNVDVAVCVEWSPTSKRRNVTARKVNVAWSTAKSEVDGMDGTRCEKTFWESRDPTAQSSQKNTCVRALEKSCSMSTSGWR